MKRLLFASLALWLSACATGSKAAKFDPNQPASSQAKSFLVAEETDDLKNIKRVFISSFNVMFAVKSGASTQAGGGYGQKTENLHAYYHLKGVDDARMQAITEKLYEDAKAKLTAAGYEVVEIQSEPTFQKIVQTAEPSPYEQKSSGFAAKVFSPKGLGVWAGPGSVVATMGKGGVMDLSSGEMPANYEAALMQEKGLDAVRFTMAVDFAKLETTGGTYGARSASVGATMGLTIPRGSMQFLSHTHVKSSKKPFFKPGLLYSYGEKPVNIHLKQPIVAQGEFVTEVKDATPAGVAIVQGLLGGRTDKTYEVVVNPDAYQNLTVTHGNALMDMAMARSGKGAVSMD